MFCLKDNHRVISECLELFRTRDYIMEPNILPTLRNYFKAGGNVEQAVELLANNYDAVGTTNNLLAEWLLTTDMNISDVQTWVEDNLKQMIIKYFDPVKADSIFTSDKIQNAPLWLDEMIKFPTWRQLIYKLAEDFPDCLMLKYTVKLISDAGHPGEIRSISSASQQIEVFTRILKNSIETFVKGSEEKMSNDLLEFIKLVCHGEHTYLYSVSLLHLLSLEPRYGGILKRLAQEIANYSQKDGNDSTPISIALLGAASHSRVAAALSAMLAKNALNPADITILYKFYQQSIPSDAPPVEFLRIPQFLDLLVEALFKPGSKLHSEHRSKYVFLLAYATSVFETYKKPNNYQSYNNVLMRKTVNQDELKSTVAAIEKVSAMCSERKGSSEILPELASLFRLVQNHQVVAYGIIYWARQVVLDASFFKLNTEAIPLHMILLDEVATCHSMLHNKLLELYINIFEMDYDDLEVLAQLEVRKMLLDRMVHLLAKGCALPVIAYIKGCWQADNTDISLIRYAVVEILSMVEPPYSDDFVQAFLPLVNCEDVTGNLKSDSEMQMVSSFIRKFCCLLLSPSSSSSHCSPCPPQTAAKIPVTIDLSCPSTNKQRKQCFYFNLIRRPTTVHTRTPTSIL